MLKVINNQAVKYDHNPKVGQFYGRIDFEESIYMVTSTINEDGNLRYVLINLNSGQAYSRVCIFIKDIFGNNLDKFYLITKETTLIIG